MAMFESPQGSQPALPGLQDLRKKKLRPDEDVAGMTAPLGATPPEKGTKIGSLTLIPGSGIDRVAKFFQGKQDTFNANLAAHEQTQRSLLAARVGQPDPAATAGADPIAQANAAMARVPRPVVFDPATPAASAGATPKAGGVPAPDPVIGHFNGKPMTRSQAEATAARVHVAQPGWPVVGAPNGGVAFTPANSGGVGGAGAGGPVGGDIPMPTSTNTPASGEIPRPVASAPVGADFRSNLPGQDAGGGVGGGGLGGGGQGSLGGVPNASQADPYKVRLAVEKADKTRGQIEDAAWRAGLRAKHTSSGGSAQHAQANLIGTLAQFGGKQLDTEVGVATGNRDAQGKAATTNAEQAGATQRTGMQDSGETRRTEIKEAGATARTNIANIARPVGAVTPAMQFEQDNKTYQTLLANPPMPGDPAGAAAHQQQLAALQAKLAGYMSAPSSPAIATNEQTGQRISFNPQTQQWEPI